METINMKLYETFRKELNLTEEKSKALALAIEEVIQEDIKKSTNDYKSLWKEDFYTLDKRILESKNDLEKKILESKNDTYKAIFITSIFQLVAILSGLLAIVKFFMEK